MLEKTILANLVFSEDFTRKVLPFLKEEYFNRDSEKVVFNQIATYVMKYNGNPTREAITIELESREDIPEQVHAEAMELTSSLASENNDMQWLLDKTEEFCKQRALFNAIKKSIGIMDGKGDEGVGALPKILSDALAVSFDTHIGHDYLTDADDRFQFYHTKEDKVPFDLAILNKATNEGILKKTLNILLAGTGVGKTLIMCHFAASYLLAGMNVLYITCEMAEERIAERIDANLLDIPLDELRTIPKEIYDKKIARIKGKTTGRLIIKEYPPTTANAAHFRHLLNELKLKKNFVADVIFIDYLNICASSRLKMGGAVNSYLLIKSIAEELRGLAVEFGVPIWSATQTNRDGYTSSELGLEHTSESFGLPMTADFMLAAFRNDELDQLGQIMFTQLKSRYADKANLAKFVVGCDRSKMRLYDVEQSAQDDISGSGGGSEPFFTKEMEEETSVFDRSGFGAREIDEKSKKWKKLFV